MYEPLDREDQREVKQASRRQADFPDQFYTGEQKGQIMADKMKAWATSNPKVEKSPRLPSDFHRQQAPYDSLPLQEPPVDRDVNYHRRDNSPEQPASPEGRFLCPFEFHGRVEPDLKLKMNKEPLRDMVPMMSMVRNDEVPRYPNPPDEFYDHREPEAILPFNLEPIADNHLSIVAPLGDSDPIAIEFTIEPPINFHSRHEPDSPIFLSPEPLPDPFSVEPQTDLDDLPVRPNPPDEYHGRKEPEPYLPLNGENASSSPYDYTERYPCNADWRPGFPVVPDEFHCCCEPE
jgi:hypothetical protein